MMFVRLLPDRPPDEDCMRASGALLPYRSKQER